jgi:hypothetical protein
VPVAAADISSGTGQNHSTRLAGFHGEAEGEICAARAAFQPPLVKSDPEPLHHGAFILSALRDEAVYCSVSRYCSGMSNWLRTAVLAG